MLSLLIYTLTVHGHPILDLTATLAYFNTRITLSYVYITKRKAKYQPIELQQWQTLRLIGVLMESGLNHHTELVYNGGTIYINALLIIVSLCSLCSEPVLTYNLYSKLYSYWA